MLLIEENVSSIQVLNEASDEGKKLYMKGIMSEANRKNRNGRIYSIKDMKLVESQINDAATANRHILCELDHPSTLEVKLDNVSHRLMEAKLDGDTLNFKAEILEKTPKGAILASLVESGVTVGVSTRGSGQVNENTGEVSNYRFICLDAVATPSCASAAISSSIREQLEMYGRGEIVTDLSEATLHDPLAQEYFAIEMKKFIQSMYN